MKAGRKRQGLRLLIIACGLIHLFLFSASDLLAAGSRSDDQKITIRVNDGKRVKTHKVSIGDYRKVRMSRSEKAAALKQYEKERDGLEDARLIFVDVFQHGLPFIGARCQGRRFCSNTYLYNQQTCHSPPFGQKYHKVYNNNGLRRYQFVAGPAGCGAGSERDSRRCEATARMVAGKPGEKSQR